MGGEKGLHAGLQGAVVGVEGGGAGEHGGHIEVDSRPGQTRFTVQLPTVV